MNKPIKLLVICNKQRVMQEKGENFITVRARINGPVKKVWELWTGPDHILQWNHASDDWHTTLAKNDLRPGGRFMSRMEAKDGSSGFDFSGVYRKVVPNKQIDYTIDDGRNVEVDFSGENDYTIVTVTFEAENMNPAELQRTGWQAILNNFKKYCESYT